MIPLEDSRAVLVARKRVQSVRDNDDGGAHGRICDQYVLDAQRRDSRDKQRQMNSPAKLCTGKMCHIFKVGPGNVAFQTISGVCNILFIEVSSGRRSS